jgi:hypothetical protein
MKIEQKDGVFMRFLLDLWIWWNFIIKSIEEIIRVF